MDQGEDHSDLPEHAPVTITVADTQERVLNIKIRQQKPEQEDAPSWEDWLLHSMYHQGIEKVADREKSSQWLD